MARPPRVHGAHDVVFHAPFAGPLLHRGAELPSGGAETQVVIIARELARRGLRVAIVVASPAVPPSVDGIDVIHQRKLRLGPLGTFFATFAALRQANARLIVQCNASMDTAYVAVAARLMRRRFAFQTVNVVDFEYDRLQPSRLKRAAYRLGVRLADEVVAQTREQVRLSQERFGRPARLAVCVSEPAPPRHDRPDAFLWIGRLAWYKRPQAYLDLAAAVPEARFRMVGVPSGPDGERLAAEVEERARTLPNVELLPPRPRDELGPLYESAVAVVNTAEFEGMPNIYLEGWARGAPALAERHDPDGMIAREGLGLFANGDPKRLTELARSLWAARESNQEMEARCVAYVREHHSLSAIGDVWVDIVAAPGAGPALAQRNASAPPRAADATDA